MANPVGGLSFSGEILVKLRAPAGAAPAGAFFPEAVARAAGLEYAEPFLSGAGTFAAGPATPALDEVARWHVFRVPAAAAPSLATEAPAVDEEEAWAAVREALRRPEVEWAEPDAILDLPIDPAAFVAGDLPDSDWHLAAIRAADAWGMVEARGKTPGEGVVVAHLDTGWTDHPAVPRDRFVSPGRDLAGGGPDARDPLQDLLLGNPGHGTGTLCLLAAGHAHYRGVAWGCRILPLRISPSVVHIRTRTMAEGILAAAEGGAEVITISMGGLPSRLWADAVNRAYERGAVICAAAGNNVPLPFGLRTPTRVVYPARFDRVLAVSGVTRQQRRYWFDDRLSGNDGDEVDLCAPTPDVRWAVPPAGYRPGAGTSTATPQVAGAAAIWLSYHRDALAGFTPIEKVEACRRALLVGAAQVPGVSYEASDEGYGRLHHDWFGTGRLDVAGALAQLPVRGLPAQEKASVSWALLKLLGIASGSAADASADELADQLRMLYALETGGVAAIARDVALRPARRVAAAAAVPSGASGAAGPAATGPAGAAPPAAPRRRGRGDRGRRQLLVIPRPAALAAGMAGVAGVAGLMAFRGPRPAPDAPAPTPRRAVLDARRSALTAFAQLAVGGVGPWALGLAAAPDEAPAGVSVLEGIGALVVDEDAADRTNLEQLAEVFDNIDVPLPPTPAPLAVERVAPWHLHRIGAAAAWSAGLRGAGTLIGVLDTGVDAGHPELAGKAIHFAEFDATGRLVSGTPRDADHHGTHVCGLLAGRSCGVAPAADLAVAAVLTQPGPRGVTGSLVQIAAGLDWLVRTAFRGADEVGVDVVNMSLGVVPYDRYLYTILGTARFAGIPAVAAIGNAGRLGPGFHGSPGNYDIVMGVGATDARDAVAAFSDWGTVAQHGGRAKPDLCAPGVDVTSSVPGGGYAALDGTSMASPLVAGSVALLCGENGPFAGAAQRNVEAIFAGLLSLVVPVPAAPRERLGAGLLWLGKLGAVRGRAASAPAAAPAPAGGQVAGGTAAGAPVVAAPAASSPPVVDPDGARG